MLKKVDRAKEEKINALTHWIGFAFGIVGLTLLLYLGNEAKNISKIISFCIYGISFSLMYLASALYHSEQGERKRGLLRVFDHLSIFLFIAGSYTPIIALSFSGVPRIFFLSLIWSIAIFGVIFKISTIGRFDRTKKISLFLYLALGWTSVFMIKPIIENTSILFMILLLIGGILYTLGTVFYSNRKIPYNHAIWHLFVLGGSIVHFIGIYQFYGLS